MKSWKCPQCAREKQTVDDRIMVICGGCQVTMEISPYNFQREVEVSGDNERNKIYSD